MRSKLLTLVTFTLLLSSLSACHGILDELYDEPSDEVTLKAHPAGQIGIIST